jgi:hypothetical protein
MLHCPIQDPVCDLLVPATSETDEDRRPGVPCKVTGSGFFVPVLATWRAA